MKVVLVILIVCSTMVQESRSAMPATYGCIKTSGSGAVPVDVKQEIIKGHNTLRDMHVNTPALAYDEGLASFAQAHADTLLAAGRLALWHSTDLSARNAGENLYRQTTSTSNEFVPARVLVNWYNERKGYNFAATTGDHRGMFTQMVWKSTKSVGCGVVTADKGGYRHVVMVCQYHPRGNMGGSYADNVMLPKPGAPFPVAVKDIALLGCCDFSADCSVIAAYPEPWKSQYCGAYTDSCCVSCP